MRKMEDRRRRDILQKEQAQKCLLFFKEIYMRGNPWRSRARRFA